MWRRIVSSHLKTLAASYFAASSPRRLIVCNPVRSANRSAISAFSSDFVRRFSSEPECRFSSNEHIKTPAVAAASPRRFVVCNPVGLLHITANRSAISASSFVFPRHFSSESDENKHTSVKKNVEDDVMPIATGNEREKERCLSSGDGSDGGGASGRLAAKMVLAAAVLVVAAVPMVSMIITVLVPMVMAVWVPIMGMVAMAMAVRL